jgi:hypothetical protein
VPGEASKTMVELGLWPSIVLLSKLAIYCDILRMMDFLCTMAMKEGNT